MFELQIAARFQQMQQDHGLRAQAKKLPANKYIAGN